MRLHCVPVAAMILAPKQRIIPGYWGNLHACPYWLKTFGVQVNSPLSSHNSTQIDPKILIVWEVRMRGCGCIVRGLL